MLYDITKVAKLKILPGRLPISFCFVSFLGETHSN